jgi:DNA-binding NtrC family response regulator
MFGHEKGSFTGASCMRIGRFEEAHGGTLLLDEVGDLSPDNQARLLRAVETGTFRRVGGTRDIAVDVRLVAATNRTLAPEAFRTDLFYRLNGLSITMPPLREHVEDIPALTNHFLHNFSRQVPGGATSVSPEALKSLDGYDWPGNVRELKAAVERAVMFCDGPELGLRHFHLGTRTPCLPGEPCEPLTLAEIERRHIIAVLQANEGNVSAAARVLDINRVTLYKRIAAYGIEP